MIQGMMLIAVFHVFTNLIIDLLMRCSTRAGTGER